MLNQQEKKIIIHILLIECLLLICKNESHYESLFVNLLCVKKVKKPKKLSTEFLYKIPYQ